MSNSSETIMEADKQNPSQVAVLSQENGSAYDDMAPFTLIWQNLTYKVDQRPWFKRAFSFSCSKSAEDPETSVGSVSSVVDQHPSYQREKVILSQICGDAKSGQLTGILGPSGAGKSTLLQCLFQNRTGTSGRILVDTNKRRKLKVCFIPQKDHLNETLTVREDLLFVSKLKRAKATQIDNDDDHNHDNHNLSAAPTDKAALPSLLVKQSGKSYETTTSPSNYDANVLRIAEIMGLTNCLDVLIRNISGGQKKRLGIARELMSKPDILILDEPTTGLDSLTCLKTVTVLRNLAHNSPYPLAVMITIHQPSRAVFELFDKTYFLSNKGRVVFDDCPTNVITTLADVAKVRTTSLINTASLLIEISSDSMKQEIVDKLSEHQRTTFMNKYDSNHIRRLVQAKQRKKIKSPKTDGVPSSISGSIQDVPNSNGSSTPGPIEIVPKSVSENDNISASASSGSLDDGNEYFMSYHLRNCLSGHKFTWSQSLRQTMILTHRSWITLVRDQSLLRSRFFFHATLPLFMLTIFGSKIGTPNSCPRYDPNLDINDMLSSVNDEAVKTQINEIRVAIENVSFFLILLYGFSINIISTTASFYPLRINLLAKETINGLYPAGPPFIGQMLAELPFEIFFPAMSVIMAYSLSGQVSSYLEWRMFAITLLALLLCYTVHCIGLMSGSIFIDNITIAIILGQIAIFPALLFSGIIVRLSRMPEWMVQLSSLSFYKHTLIGILVSRYGFNLCECDEEMFDNDSNEGIADLPDNVKHVLDYMFPKNESDGVQVSEMFSVLADKFNKAQAFASNITSCEDVKPYVMTNFSAKESDLFSGLMALFATIVVFKTLTFLIVRRAPYRIY